MTIGRKLYAGFGAILAIMLFLFVLNILTMLRQNSVRDAVSSTLSDVQMIESVRYKIIENRLSLGNYLLSGDLRDEEKTNKGISELEQASKDDQTKVSDPGLRSALALVEDNENGWVRPIPRRLVAYPPVVLMWRCNAGF